MSLAELLGNLSLETQISIGGLIFLVVVLTALQASSRRNQRELEQALAEREMRSRLDQLMLKLDGKNISRNGRLEPSVVRLRPVRRDAEKHIPAARCDKPSGVRKGVGRR